MKASRNDREFFKERYEMKVVRYEGYDNLSKIGSRTLRTACTKKALKYETKYKWNYVDRSIYQDLSKVTEIPQLPTEDPKKAKPHPLL